MKNKKFDCVKMKEECQQAVLKKYGGLPPEERKRRMEADILADPVLGKIFRQTFRPDGLNAGYKPAARVAESKAEYKTGSGEREA